MHVYAKYGGGLTASPLGGGNDPAVQWHVLCHPPGGETEQPDATNDFRNDRTEGGKLCSRYNLSKLECRTGSGRDCFRPREPLRPRLLCTRNFQPHTASKLWFYRLREFKKTNLTTNLFSVRDEGAIEIHSAKAGL
jgi:hypothetical protein